MLKNKAAWVGLILTLWMCYGRGEVTHAQGPATPIPVNPPTATATPLPPTDVPTRTPTSLGPASVEALTADTNVRAEPDISAERLGGISPGQKYSVIGKYFEWFQIQYDQSRTGRGWVHQSVVTIIGDESLIPDLSTSGLPTDDPAQVSAEETAAILIQTPGGEAQLTALAPAPQIATTPLTSGDAPVPIAPQGDSSFPQGGLLPTFTFAPITATPLNLQALRQQQGVTIVSGGLPPIAPILAFLGVGVLGILIGFLRR